MTTGETIRARRLELGMTQKEAAAHCGLSKETFGLYERDVSSAPKTLERIAARLNVELPERRRPKPKPKPGAEPRRIETVREHCRHKDCIYRSGAGSETVCYYMGFTGRPRGCRISECDKHRAAAKRRNGFSRNFEIRWDYSDEERTE